jgi:ribosomal protein L14
MLNVIDNSGAAVAECIQVLKMKRHAKIGIHPLQHDEMDTLD